MTAAPTDPSGMFIPRSHVVVAAVDCTWCGVRLGFACRDRLGNYASHTHAQRWRDYWNATHDEQVPVYVDPKRRSARA